MRQTQSVCPGTSLLMVAVAAGVLRDVSWQSTKMGLSTASALISPTLEYWWSVDIIHIPYIYTVRVKKNATNAAWWHLKK